MSTIKHIQSQFPRLKSKVEEVLIQEQNAKHTGNGVVVNGGVNQAPATARFPREYRRYSDHFCGIAGPDTVQFFRAPSSQAFRPLSITVSDKGDFEFTRKAVNDQPAKNNSAADYECLRTVNFDAMEERMFLGLRPILRCMPSSIPPTKGSGLQVEWEGDVYLFREHFKVNEDGTVENDGAHFINDAADNTAKHDELHDRIVELRKVFKMVENLQGLDMKITVEAAEQEIIKELRATLEECRKHACIALGVKYVPATAMNRDELLTMYTDNELAKVLGKRAEVILDRFEALLTKMENGAFTAELLISKIFPQFIALAMMVNGSGLYEGNIRYYGKGRAQGLWNFILNSNTKFKATQMSETCHSIKLGLCKELGKTVSVKNTIPFALKQSDFEDIL